MSGLEDLSSSDDDFVAMSPIPDMMTPCMGCSYVITGLHSTHCCKRCSRGKGHGSGCEQRSLPPDTEDPSASASSAAPRVLKKCDYSRCIYAATGVHETHCCKSCARGLSHHHPSCQHVPASAVPPDPVTNRCQAGDCPFAVTGEHGTHCCGLCARGLSFHSETCKKEAPVVVSSDTRRGSGMNVDRRSTGRIVGRGN